jgi:hypothetical protein
VLPNPAASSPPPSHSPSLVLRKGRRSVVCRALRPDARGIIRRSGGSNGKQNAAPR